MRYSRIDNNTSSVLIVEHDPLMLTAIGSVLNMQGHRTVLARTEEVAIEAIGQGTFDVIIFSIDALEAGCTFASRMRASSSTQDAPLIFLVPPHQGNWDEQLAAHGGVFSMIKPGDPHALIDLVEKSLWLPHVAKGRVAAPNVLQEKVLQEKPLQEKQQDWVSLDD